jgi:hypothetical protein
MFFIEKNTIYFLKQTNLASDEGKLTNITSCIQEIKRYLFQVYQSFVAFVAFSL